MIDPLQNLLGYALRRASAMTLAELNVRLEAFGVRHVDASVLLLISQNDGITLSKIGEILGIQRANMTPLVARLEERGLVIRAPIDGRSHGLSVTTTGADCVADITTTMNDHEKSLIARIPLSHREAFRSALDALWTPTHHTESGD